MLSISNRRHMETIFKKAFSLYHYSTLGASQVNLGFHSSLNVGKFYEYAKYPVQYYVMAYGCGLAL